MDDLQDRLNQIDWALYRHAYGSAENIPQHILNLFGSDQSIAAKSIDYLDSSLCHQRIAVDDAAEPAFPFFISALPLTHLSEKNFGYLVENLWSMAVVLFSEKDRNYHSNLYLNMRQAFADNLSIFQNLENSPNDYAREFLVEIVELIDQFEYDENFEVKEFQYPFSWEATLDEMLPYINSEEVKIRGRIAYELHRCEGPQEQIFQLLSVFLNDDDEYVRVYAVQSLKKLKAIDFTNQLIEIAKNEPSLLVLTNIIKFFGGLKINSAIPFLIELASHEDDFIRYHVVNAFGDIEDQRAIPALKHLEKDPSKPIRYHKNGLTSQSTTMSVGKRAAYILQNFFTQ